MLPGSVGKASNETLHFSTLTACLPLRQWLSWSVGSVDIMMLWARFSKWYLEETRIQSSIQGLILDAQICC